MIGDIGYLIMPISFFLVFFCPFWSLCAQLLANAQAQAAVDNKKVSFLCFLFSFDLYLCHKKQ